MIVGTPRRARCAAAPHHDAARDRLRARPLHRRPARRQARGRDRAAQPLAAPAGAGGPARRDRAQEHHHDRPDRRREDRDLAPPREARAGAVPQGRGVEVHRGRLRRPRRRVDRPRPRRARDQHGARRRRRRRSSARARELAEERLLDLLLPSRTDAGSPAASRRDAADAERRHAARSSPHAARGQARRPHGRARGHQAASRRWSRS